ncbi:egl nine homolog 1-like [Octopus vulgaris]|uniref:hypoxia-inducible factor-proline dioxygenase n=1 Tax=Octopus vulgaris TaxID=6645 RepID=A0AA36FCW5_OCTVU|nr:egl nine homolog 1-like [Octopus vulgaris]
MSTTKICQLCGTFENLSLCGGCRNAWYCSQDHQKSDWKVHKKSCKSKQRSQRSDLNSSASISSSSILSSSSEPESFNQQKKNKEVCKKTNKRKPKSKTNHLDPCGATEECISSKVKSTTNLSSVEKTEVSTGVAIQNNSKSSANNKNVSMQENTSREVQSLKPNSTSAKTDQTIVHTQSEQTHHKMTLNTELVNYVIDSMKKYGICLVDNFVGGKEAELILNEAKALYDSGNFTQGLLVNNKVISNEETKVRGDMIMWVDGSESGCKNIKGLLDRTDSLILTCKGQLDRYTIKGRTKAMIACYPGNDAGYIRHVDNPNKDGRCITCIYYLNKDWDVERDGGLLRIFPEGQENVANVIPKFDRLLFFWSDRRNPHEVLPTKRSRYAITVWYYDAEEKAAADKLSKCLLQNVFIILSIHIFILVHSTTKIGPLNACFYSHLSQKR